MKSMLIPLLVVCCVCEALAQLPPACAGGSTATSCATACINCNFNGFVGNTTGFPSGIVPNFCGTVENAQWLGFIAGTDHATFTVTPADCINGDGVQIALYEDCMGMPVACAMGEMNGGNLPVSLDVPLTPGRNYFLLIDGYAGDQCDFSVSVSPESAVYEPPLGTIGSVTGPAQVCPGATMQYSVTPVFGASAYIWSGPTGAMIDTMPLPVTLTGSGANTAMITFGNTGGAICVQAANSCNQTPACSNPYNVEMLDDSFRPVLTADTSAHLTCSGEPAILDVTVQAGAGFNFQWTADSTGHIVGSTQFHKTTVDKTGTYTLTVANNQNGCTSSISIQVGTPDTPHTADLRLKHITCYGYEDGILTIGEMESGLPPFVYALDDDAFKVAPEFRYLTPGEHTLHIESADECRWDTTFTVLEPADWLLNLGLDDSLHLGDEMYLLQDMTVSEPDRIAQMLVRPQELSELLCEDCPYSPLHSFRYTLTLVDSNGCTATDSRIIAVTKERHVYAPNVFAPQSLNEANHKFTVYGGADVDIVEWLRVFDRWGQLIYERDAFSPGDNAGGWDGRVKGDAASPGVFVWQANILFKDGISETWSGNVTVVR